MCPCNSTSMSTTTPYIRCNWIFSGRQHIVVMTVCSCEPHAATMLRYNVWPSSPSNPYVAFHLELMEWFRILVLECQVSLHGFCKALKHRFGSTWQPNQEVYNFELYSYFVT